MYHSRQQYLAQAERERHATHIQSWLDDISDWNTITYSGSSAEEMKSFIHSLAA